MCVMAANMCVMKAGHVLGGGRALAWWRQGMCVIEAGHVRDGGRACA